VVYFDETKVKRKTIKQNKTINKERRKPIFSIFSGYTCNTFLKKRILSNSAIKNATIKINLT